MAVGSFSKILNNNKFPCSDRFTLFIFKKMSSSVWIAVVCQFFSENVFHRKGLVSLPSETSVQVLFLEISNVPDVQGECFRGTSRHHKLCPRCNRNICDCFLKDILKVNGFFWLQASGDEEWPPCSIAPLPWLGLRVLNQPLLYHCQSVSQLWEEGT